MHCVVFFFFSLAPLCVKERAVPDLWIELRGQYVILQILRQVITLFMEDLVAFSVASEVEVVEKEDSIRGAALASDGDHVGGMEGKSG
jgi:hypothetical protein